MNKFFAILCLVCMVLMAGLVSCFGGHIPDHWTLGKTISAIFFYTYEVMCVCGCVYFWFKKDQL